MGRRTDRGTGNKRTPSTSTTRTSSSRPSPPPRPLAACVCALAAVASSASAAFAPSRGSVALGRTSPSVRPGVRPMEPAAATSGASGTATDEPPASAAAAEGGAVPNGAPDHGRFDFDDAAFDAYAVAVAGSLPRKLPRDCGSGPDSRADLDAARGRLLDRRRRLPRRDAGAFLRPSSGGRAGDDDGDDSDGRETEDAARGPAQSCVKRRLRERSEAYLRATGTTPRQHRLATVLLGHLADHCAKRKTPGPLRLAWEKVLEAGMVPLGRTLSTYLYVLSLEEGEGGKGGDGNDNDEPGRDVAAEVAALHDALYGPTEKTTTLLVKSLVSRGDADGAEALLADISEGPLGETLRHRTTSPLLDLYCERGRIDAALRLYHRMRTTSRVKMDAETYASFIAAVARTGFFRLDAECIAGAEELGYGDGRACGPGLLDALVAEMAGDVLDIDEGSARRMRDGFKAGFGESGRGAIASSEGMDHATTLREDGALVADRVAIDASTARCPATGATLRLITLEESQRRHVHDTLLEMAREKSIEYTARLAAQGRPAGGGPEEASRVLGEFSAWLDARDGRPYTAVVDGANVAYYGWGRINVHQLMHMVEALEGQGEDVLVVFPRKYTRRKFHLRKGVIQVLKDDEVEFLEGLEREGKMYIVPPMCLDDLYWMLASVSDQTTSAGGRAIHVPKNNDWGRFPGPRPMVITNDKMRDHKMDLIDERAFRRWCCSHIVNYDFDDFVEDPSEERAICFRAADVFSDEIQGNVAGGGGRTAWHFPVSEWADDERFCLRLPS